MPGVSIAAASARIVLGDARSDLAEQRRVARQALVVYPLDRRAGQDVVELVEQHLLPDRLQPRRRVGGAGQRRGQHGGPLQLAQRQLHPAVVPLVARLGGERALVPLQVELARPRWRSARRPRASARRKPPPTPASPGSARPGSSAAPAAPGAPRPGRRRRRRCRRPSGVVGDALVVVVAARSCAPTRGAAGLL